VKQSACGLAIVVGKCRASRHGYVVSNSLPCPALCTRWTYGYWVRPMARLTLTSLVCLWNSPMSISMGYSCTRPGDCSFLWDSWWDATTAGRGPFGSLYTSFARLVVLFWSSQLLIGNTYTLSGV